MNYFNRNATSNTTQAEIVTGYSGAISSSLLVMYTCRKVIQRMGVDISHGKGRALSLMVNVLGSMTASGINCFLMRMKELKGVVVQDKDGKDIGPSQKAGKIVIESMVISRLFLSFCCVGIPVALILGFGRFKM